MVFKITHHEINLFNWLTYWPKIAIYWQRNLKKIWWIAIVWYMTNIFHFLIGDVDVILHTMEWISLFYWSPL